MAAVVTEKELYRACEILFGHKLPATREFLEYLQLSGVKSAFRQRARETHPDLAVHLGAAVQRQRADLFRAVCQAHEHLVNYLEARAQGYQLPPAKRRLFCYDNLRNLFKARARTGSDGQAGRRDRRVVVPNDFSQNFQGRLARPEIDLGKLYQGPLPSRELLFGHFLYYSGLIDWQTIVRVLVWQRSRRPRFGEIGCSFGWLREDDILPILRQCRIKQPFGQSAVSLGLLTELQMKTILFRQQRLQKKFGEYFTESNIMTPERLARLIARHQAHNAGFAGPPFRSRIFG